MTSEPTWPTVFGLAYCPDHGIILPGDGRCPYRLLRPEQWTSAESATRHPNVAVPLAKCSTCEVTADDLDPRDTPDPASEFRAGPNGLTYCRGCLGVVFPPASKGGEA